MKEAVISLKIITEKTGPGEFPFRETAGIFI